MDSRLSTTPIEVVEEACVGLRKKLRTILVCFTLEWAALVGVPVKVEQIEELMRALNQAQVAHTLPEEHRESED